MSTEPISDHTVESIKYTVQLTMESQTQNTVMKISNLKLNTIFKILINQRLNIKND